MSASIFVAIGLIVTMQFYSPILNRSYTTSDSPPLTMRFSNDDAHLDVFHNDADHNNAAHVDVVTPQVEAAVVARYIVSNNFMVDLEPSVRLLQCYIIISYVSFAYIDDNNFRPYR